MAKHGKVGIRRPPRLMSDRLAIRRDDLARPTLAHLIGRGEMRDSFSFGGGRYHFLTEGLSKRHCRAWHRPTASSAWRFPP